MRLWTLHPRYLDVRGLTALWREALLAQKVLQGGTRGYRNHPQLVRFRASPDPLGAIGAYLAAVAAEAHKRGYAYDSSRIASPHYDGFLEETEGQLRFEGGHLAAKLAVRSPQTLAALPASGLPDHHPLFRIVPGPVAVWEKTSQGQ